MEISVSVNDISIGKVPEVSAVLARCWRAAYKGVVDDAYLAALEDSHWEEFLANSIDDKTTACIVAEDESQVVGVSIFGKSITEKYPDDGEIIALYVLPEFIGQKIGHLLFEQAQQSIRAQGYRDCTICTFKQNIKAIRFYESRGYAVVSEDETIAIGSQDVPYFIMRKSL